MKTKKTYLSAFIVFLIIISWVGSGIIEREFFNESDGASSQQEANQTGTKDNSINSSQPITKKLVKVRFRTSKAHLKKQNITIRGRTEVKRRVIVKSEANGKVKVISVHKGAIVKKGDILCEIDPGAKNANLAQSKASYAQAVLDFEVTNTLAAQGHLAKNKKIAIKAQLDAAKAHVILAELEIEHTKIKVPFDGVIEDEPAILGELLQPGSKCATLVELDPILAVGYVSERQVNQLSLGNNTTVKLSNDKNISGKITYISPVAEKSTRTFRIEVEIANSDKSIRAGISANIAVTLQAVIAHQFSPAILSLADDGNIGIKVLDNDNKVVFKNVTIIDDISGEGVLVKGLDDVVRIITVGQEYVSVGQIVEAIGE